MSRVRVVYVCPDVDGMCVGSRVGWVHVGAGCVRWRVPMMSAILEIPSAMCVRPGVEPWISLPQHARVATEVGGRLGSGSQVVEHVHGME